MKLRIHGDSIRLRLNRREVAQFAAGGKLEESCRYGPGREDIFSYVLEASRTAPEPTVRVAGQTLSVILPEVTAEAWTGTEQVGVTADVAIANGKSMLILIEKEFRRVHGPNSDPDLYPNPLESKLR